MAFEELKERQSVMWGNGPFDRIAASIEDLHESVAESLAVRSGRARARPRLRHRAGSPS